jgi:hypothetical protein
MSEESDNENMFLLFVGLGILYLGLAASYLFLEDFSQLISWLFAGSGVLFLVLAFTIRYKDSDGSQDWI